MFGNALGAQSLVPNPNQDHHRFTVCTNSSPKVTGSHVECLQGSFILKDYAESCTDNLTAELFDLQELTL